MNIYDRLFISMYYLSGKTSADEHPTLYSALLIMTGFECVNLSTVYFIYLRTIHDSVTASNAQILSVILIVLLINIIYVAMQGRRVIGHINAIENKTPHRYALIYGALSFAALLGVMISMFFK